MKKTLRIMMDFGQAVLSIIFFAAILIIARDVAGANVNSAVVISGMGLGLYFGAKISLHALED